MKLLLKRSVGALIALATIPVLVLVIAAPASMGAYATATVVKDWWSSVPEKLEIPPLPQRSTIVDADGNFLAEVYLYNRQVVPSDKISPWVKKAVVAIEDRRFYEHRGVDPEALARAVVANVRSGGWSEGGSTITQQFVKNSLALGDLNGDDSQAWVKASEKTLDRKFREARLALDLERRMSKDDILSGYLNTSNFGNGTYGIEAAARFYFNVSAADLDLAQSALLAGLLQSPSRLDPLDNPFAAAHRRSLVLEAMVDTGAITEQQSRLAMGVPLPSQGTPPPGRCAQSYAPFYCTWVEEQLISSPLLGATEEERRQRLAQGGLVIHTALDPRVQRIAEQAASKVPARNRLASAIAMVRPGTGEVLALATSRKWGDKPARGETQLLLPTREVFQPGSTFKPFTVAAALNEGLDPGTVLPAGVTYKSKKFENPEKGYFSNYSSTPWSNLTLREALKWSVNTAFVQLQEKVGTREVARVAQALGVSNLPVSGPDRIKESEGSLTLGARETSVVNMANAYASIAAGGKACPATGVTLVTDRDGNRLDWVSTPTCKQVIAPAAAAATTAMMRAVVDEGTGTNAQIKGRQVAGKTGTTNNSAAVWFAGFTPELSAAVWIGDPRGPKYSVDGELGYASMTGGSLPADIWRAAMKGALKGVPASELPAPTRLSVLGDLTEAPRQTAGLPPVVKD